jgi:7-cyano-7-deazaguanine synthase
MHLHAVILLSGGMDSATTAAVARAEGFDVFPIAFNYGQRHQVEITAARRVCAHLGLREPVIIPIDLRAFGNSALTADIAVPKDRDITGSSDLIPITYVPARNTIFLSYALAYAEVVKAFTLFIGANAMDFSGYPDCRPDYLVAFQTMANLATRAGREHPGALRIRAPLVEMTKAQIVRKGIELGVDFSLTTSCYDPDQMGHACARCDACQLRLKGFLEAGIADPIQYSATQLDRVT